MWLEEFLVGWLDVSEIIRLEVFFGMFALIAFLERLIPARRHGWQGRVLGNTGLQLVNVSVQVVLLSVAPLTLSAIALQSLFSQFGMLHHLQIGLWEKIFIAWLVLDLASYGWHRAWHSIPVLWRFHRIHHLDPFLDVLTTFRTHPVEMVMTLFFRGGIVYLLGVPLLGVILYEIIILVMALWIHGNLRVHPTLDRMLAWLVVTPGVHRMHHRAQKTECDCNFGLILTVWDRMFGTYRREDACILTGPGLIAPDIPFARTLPGMIWLPFRMSDK